MDYQKIIDKFYPADSPLRDIYISHCRAVAREALAISSRKQLPLETGKIEAAAMLHDIGIFLTNAPSIHCHGTEPYIRHGILGRDLLLMEGADPELAEVAARHTGSGLTPEEISSQNLPLPAADFCPQTLLEKLICYADKFYSKSGSSQRKPIETIRRQMEAFGTGSLERFNQLHRLFG